MDKQQDLVERLTAFYRAEGKEVQATAPAWDPRRARTPRRTWVQPVVASLGVAILALGLFIALRSLRQSNPTPARATPTVSPSVVPSASAEPSPTTGPSPSPTAASGWISRQVALPGDVISMDSDGSAVYAVFRPSAGNNSVDLIHAGVARIDRASGSVKTSGPLAGAYAVVRVNAGLWVLSNLSSPAGEQPPANTTTTMTLLDANTLQVIRTAVAPGRPDPSIFTVPVIASHGNLLWLSNGHVLYKLDPSTASVLISKNYSGIPSSLSIDPDGRWLYMGVEVASAPNATNRLIQVDATSGTQTASVAAGTPDLGGPSVSAASDGVWVTYATGMMGTVEHRSSNLLHLISSQAGAGSNGVKIFVTGSIVWIENGAGDSLGCIDPRSGSLRAGMSIDQLPAAGPVSGDTRGSWVAQGQRVDLLNPPASCYS